MSGFLLDTNVISELRRRRPNADVVAFIAAQPEHSLFLSEVTFAEIRFGIALLDDPERRASITAWLEHILRPLFVGGVLPINEDVILRWRLLLENGRKARHTFSQPDLFIAATAAEENMIVVTRDTSHFLAARIPVLDPFASVFFDAAKIAHPIDALDTPALLEQLLSHHPAQVR